MIGFFPDPYPDELLYSACARYEKRTKYSNRRSVISELFGKDGLSAAWDFPTRLSYFVSILPKGHHYSVEKLIDENTILPYYQHFIPVSRIKIVRDEMKYDHYNKIQARLGTRIKQITNPRYLRYCSACVKEDREKYGETYWYRIHQLAGILICSDHKKFLVDSSIELGRMSSSYFHDAETFVFSKPSKSTRFDPKKESHKIIYKIACDAKWLLSKGSLQFGTEIIQSRYFNILLQEGYAYYNRRLKYSKLIKNSQDFFPKDLFELIGRISKKENWIIALTQISNINITYHPIRHLLLITFLGMTAQQFFEEFNEYKPFGDPPYPCLNIASTHYKKLEIDEIKVLDNISKDIGKQGLPLGIFNCNCGFTYQRIGPDKTIEDRLTYSLVREYGQIWEQELKRLWANLLLSLGEIGNRLGISSTSVGRQAIRLNVPRNTIHTRSLEGYDRHRNPNKSFSEMRDEYRDNWLNFRENNLNLCREESAKKANFVWNWLKRNDSEWFEKHSPQRNLKKVKKDFLDWKKIDSDLSKKIEAECKKILSLDSFPIRVCITEIIRRVGYKGWIDKRHKKLPNTAQIVDQYLETLENYMIRKIKWTTQRYVKEKKIPTLLQFKTRAVVVNKTSNNSPKIQQEIIDALDEIKNSISSQ